MSGLEIAGVVLGVLPIVLRSVDTYKDSIRRISTTIRKRKYVEKLARALLLQQQILEEAVKSVVLASGCEDVLALDEDPFGYFCDEDVREQLEEFLGPKNSIALVGLLESNNDVIKKVAKSICGLVPACQDPTDDLVAVINANKEKTTNTMAEIAPRIKLMLGITDMKCTIEELDAGTAALDRFSRLVLSNRQTVQSTSSRKALRLARALSRIRTLASTLYLAILDGFRPAGAERCHDSHGTRLYLEDRVDSAADVLASRYGRPGGGAGAEQRSLLAFDLAFTAGDVLGARRSYETRVQVFDEGEDEEGEEGCLGGGGGRGGIISSSSSNTTLDALGGGLQDGSSSSTSRLLRFSSSPAGSLGARSPSPAPSRRRRSAVTSVDSICGAIERAHGSDGRVCFALVGGQPRIGTFSPPSDGGADRGWSGGSSSGGHRSRPHPLVGSMPHTVASGSVGGFVSLGEVLRAEGGVPLSWKSRMTLALRLASGLLQLLHTRWLERGWSKDVVFFPVSAAAAAAVSQPGRRTVSEPSVSRTPALQAEVDLTRPFVACAFGGGSDCSPDLGRVAPDAAAGKEVEPKLVLLELGILLLEIWHKTTLEARFGLAQDQPPRSYYDRMARAVEWLDDTDEPLPDLYDKAVAHCLRVNIGGDTRFLDWADTKLWSVVCENIIEPLATICKQWSG